MSALLGPLGHRPYTFCPTCRSGVPVDETTSWPFQDARGKPIQLNVCRACARRLSAQTPAYMAFGSPSPYIVTPQSLPNALGLVGTILIPILMGLSFLFGLKVGPPHGVLIMLGGICLGCGALAVAAIATGGTR